MIFFRRGLVLLLFLSSWVVGPAYAICSAGNVGQMYVGRVMKSVDDNPQLSLSGYQNYVCNSPTLHNVAKDRSARWNDFVTSLKDSLGIQDKDISAKVTLRIVRLSDSAEVFRCRYDFMQINVSSGCPATFTLEEGRYDISFVDMKLYYNMRNSSGVYDTIPLSTSAVQGNVEFTYPRGGWIRAVVDAVIPKDICDVQSFKVTPSANTIVFDGITTQDINDNKKSYTKEFSIEVSRIDNSICGKKLVEPILTLSNPGVKSNGDIALPNNMLFKITDMNNLRVPYDTPRSMGLQEGSKVITERFKATVLKDPARGNVTAGFFSTVVSYKVTYR